jgi:16S rRNA (uracil1498-N3)-methyltransferase
VQVDPADACPGVVVELPRQEARHLQRVLRLRSGDAISVFDGRGGEWSATLVECSTRRVAAEIGSPLPGNPEPPLALSLYPGRCETSRMEWLLQKGTELGVHAFHPCGWGGPPGALKPARLERWRRIVAEACKQSGRRWLPEVTPVTELPAAPAGGPPGLLLDADGEPASTALAGPPPPAAMLAVGPADGWSEGEASRLAAGGWRRIALGPRTLRAETAALAAATVVMHRWGDLGSRSGPAV